ncbi:MAG TPA: VOC family protein [Glycomyces sp.]|nr:VOC family protein [Glycomyces sp.]
MPRTGGRQPAGRAATSEQLRQQRLMLDQQRRQREARWWAINQNALKDLHSRQHHAAGGEAIGTILNADRRMRWRTSHAVGAITLLILSFFFASMAIGAQSIGIAVLAFLCLAGCIAFFTVEHSARRFPRPVPAPPLIGQHRLEDLIVEDDPPRPAPVSKEPATGTLDDLLGASSDAEAERPEAKTEAAQTEPVVPAAKEPKSTPEPVQAAAEPVAEPANAAVAAEPGRMIVTEPASAGPVSEDDLEPPSGGALIDASPGAAFTLPSEQIGGEPGSSPVGGTMQSSAAAVPPPVGEARPQGPIAEAATMVKMPSPPRQRTSTEGRSLAHDLAELLLTEQRVGGTDVTEVAATLVVADLQRSVEFYTDALGLTIADRTDEAAILDAGFGKILLWERPDAPAGETGVMHLTFEVGDIDTTFTKMNDAGVEFLHLPRTALLGQHYEMRAAAFRDPDGHGLAITEHRERD